MVGARLEGRMPLDELGRMSTGSEVVVGKNGMYAEID